MKITVFAKKGQTSEGRVFWNYLSTLHNKATGEVFVTQLKFRDECGAPKPEVCPVNIEFEKKDANLADRKYIDREGNERVAKVLWISAWKNSDDVYADHSLDDFE